MPQAGKIQTARLSIKTHKVLGSGPIKFIHSARDKFLMDGSKNHAGHSRSYVQVIFTIRHKNLPRLKEDDQERQISCFKQAHRSYGYAFACFHCIFTVLDQRNCTNFIGPEPNLHS